MGFVISALIVLALIATIWGRDAARGCANNLLATILFVIGGVVFVVLLSAFSVATGISHDTIADCLIGICLLLFAYLVIFIVREQVVGAREQKIRDQQKRTQAQNDLAIEQQTDRNAQAAFEQKVALRNSATRDIRDALNAGDGRRAYDLCLSCSFYWDCLALEWTGNERGGSFTHYGRTSIVPISEVERTAKYFMRFSHEEGEAILRGVAGTLEQAIYSVDAKGDARALCALLALSGFVREPRFINGAIRARMAGLLYEVATDATMSQARRVGAVVALGVCGRGTNADWSTLTDNAPSEPLCDLLNDADSQVRAAALVALGFCLRCRVGGKRGATMDHSKYTGGDFELEKEMREGERNLQHWDDQYEKSVVHLIRPLLDHDPVDMVRCEAARALERTEEPAARAALRGVAIGDGRSASVRRVASECLKKSMATSSAEPDRETETNEVLTSATNYLRDYTNRYKSHLPVSHPRN